MTLAVDPDTTVADISAVELARALEAGAPLQVLDVRAPERLASGRIECGAPGCFVNVRGSQVLATTDPAALGLNASLPTVTVCGHGNSSVTVAAHLTRLGWNARSLAGGMRAWMDAVLPRELTPPTGFERLVQLDRVGKGALAYVLVAGDAALVIDPPRDFSACEQVATHSRARIVAVADTHIHADYISGGPALAARHGAPYHVHPADHVYPYDGTPGRLDIAPLADGQRLRIGAASVGVEHTPGHTEGSVTFIAGDCAFTGDFVFIDSVGRPDLADRTAEWTGQLFNSLSRIKQQWPDDLRIYPGHYSGDSERNADRSIGAPFGEIRRRNTSLAIDDPEAFRAWVAGHIPTPPAAYRRIKGINVGIYDVSDEEAGELEAGRNECAL